MEGPNSETYAFWLDIGTKIALGVGLAAIMIFIENRRRKGVEDAHKKIIKINVTTLREIYTQAAIDVEEIETDIEGKSERLSKYMDRNYSRIEHTINNIEIHRAQRTKMSEIEKPAISKLIESSRIILDTYCPRDIPESRRANLWKSTTKFDEHYKKIVDAVSTLD